MKNVMLGIKLFATLLLCAAAAVVSHAQTFTLLHSFNGTDGQYPSPVLQGTDGNLYGTAEIGGTNLNGFCLAIDGCGTFFSISTQGTFTSLYSFCSQSNCADGDFPNAVIQGADGNFYGTTYSGGANDSCSLGCGTVFVIAPGRTPRTLYSFCSQTNCVDGDGPIGPLVQGSDGNLYGMTNVGGAHTNDNCPNGCGTVFKITRAGILTTLHSFCSQTHCPDGALPDAGLIQGADGSFYGTTESGGTHTHPVCAPGNCGTVFKITPAGALTTLYSFCADVTGGACADGARPVAELVQGTDGNYYGTTYLGGKRSNTDGNGGTVFSITADGVLTTLYEFCSLAKCADGAYPEGTLTQGTDGNFYGTTYLGGAFCPQQGCGTVFSVTPSGELTTLYSFHRSKGAYPNRGLVQDTNGTFYGTTSQGGGDNSNSCGDGCGAIFGLSVGLGQFVKTQPASGPVGAPVNILGTNLTGVTGVSFNGTPATFTVVSSSLITTTVPARATSGKVQVSNGSGNLSSNVVFRVRP